IKSIRAQIATLEKSLKEKISEAEAESAPVPLRQNRRPNEIPDAVDRDMAVDRDIEKPVERKVAPSEKAAPAPSAKGASGEPSGSGQVGVAKWSTDLTNTWGRRLRSLEISDGTSSRLVEAFPRLQFQNLQRIGKFPGMGLLWGIENAPNGNYACIWQWHDDDNAATKTALLDLKGRALDIEFSGQFETTGEVYILVSQGLNANGFQPVDLWRYELETVPPFSLRSKKGVRIASGTTTHASMGSLHDAGNGSLLIDLGEKSSLSAQTPGIRVQEARTGVWRLKVDRAANAAPSEGTLAPLSGRESGGPESASLTAKPGPVWKLQRDEAGISLIDLEGLHENQSIADLREDLDLAGGAFECTKADQTESVAIIDRQRGLIHQLSETDSGAWRTNPLAVTDRELQYLGLDSNSQMLVIDSRGTPRRLVSQRVLRERGTRMPLKLSESGWYQSIEDGKLEDAFVPIANEATHEREGVRQEVFLAVPERTRIEWMSEGEWVYPEGTLLLQTIHAPADDSLTKRESDGALGAGSHRKETRVFLRNRGQWHPFVYRWNADQTDGLSEGGIDNDQGFRVASDCSRCHIESGNNYLIGFEGRVMKGSSITNPKNSLVRELRDRGYLKRRSLVDEYRSLVERKRPLREELLADTKSSEDAPQMEIRAIEWRWFQASMEADLMRPWIDRSRMGSLAANEKDGGAGQSNGSLPDDLESQGNLIYALAIAYEATKSDVFRDLASASADALIENYVDPNHGGFYWRVDRNGRVTDGRKDLSGNARALLGLARLSAALNRPEYLEVALRNWEILGEQFENPSGGYYEEAKEDFSSPAGCSSEALLDLYEALLGLYDASRVSQIALDAERLEAFVCSRLVLDGGFIPERFESGWKTPAVQDKAILVELGNQLRWAFAISESIRLGGTHEYLPIGNGLVDFAIDRGMDEAMRGIGSYDNRWQKGRWQQLTLMRTLMRYAESHGRWQLWKAVANTKEYAVSEVIDSEGSGWFEEDGKGAKSSNILFHAIGMYMEGIRIAQSRLNP
ncbi:MAG: AGE family epimerase/isomerase, partial [Planctomycetota bacterium]